MNELMSAIRHDDNQRLYPEAIVQAWLDKRCLCSVLRSESKLKGIVEYRTSSAQGTFAEGFCHKCAHNKKKCLGFSKSARNPSE